MAREETIQYRSSHTVRLEAPTDVSVDPNNPLDNTNDGATATFRVYDPEEETTLSAAEAIGQTTLSVSSVAPFVIGDNVEVLQDDGSIHSSTVSAVDGAALTIDIAVGLTVAAAAGSRVRVRLGPIVTMTEFGTATLNNKDWGFEGGLSSTFQGLEPGRRIQIEIAFVGSGGGGLDLQEIICARVSSGCS